MRTEKSRRATVVFPKNSHRAIITSLAKSLSFYLFCLINLNTKTHEKRMRYDTNADSATVSSKNVFSLKSEKYSRLEYFKFFDSSFKEDTKLNSKYIKCIKVGTWELGACCCSLDILVNVFPNKKGETLKFGEHKLEALRNI